MNENLIPVNVIDMVNGMNNPNLTRQQNEFYLKRLRDLVDYVNMETNKYHIKMEKSKKEVQKKIVDQVASKPDTKQLLTEDKE